MLKVTIIGTSATMPLPNRAVAAMAVSINGYNILFDCGEGTQSAAKAAGVSLFKIKAICLTHFHGDHTYGLPGLLHTLGHMGRTDELLITGPVGLEQALKPIFQMCGGLPFTIKLHTFANKQQKPLPQTMEQLVGLPINLTAFPLAHRVPCVGYRIDLPRAGRFMPEKAKELNVPMPQWGKLQKGESVFVGETEISPSQVMGNSRNGLAVVYGTDTSPCKSLVKAAQDADLLICDATYAENDLSEKAAEFGHSTFAQAAEMAKQANAKKLVLTHFSASIQEPEEVLCNATDIFENTEVAFDGKVLELSFESRD